MASEPTPRAERLGPARRRPLILDAALRLLIDRGSAVVSMDAIAEAAGVTKPVVYACFESKTELFQALLEREEQRMLAHVSAAMPERPNLNDPEGSLSSGFVAFLSAVAAEPDSWRLMLLAEQGAEPEVRRRVVRGRKLQVEALRRLTVEQYATRDAADAERKGEIVANAVIAAGEAAARLMLENPGRWDPKELGAMLASLFMRGAARL